MQAEISVEEFEKLTEIALKRVAEMGLSKPQIGILIMGDSHSEAGTPPDRWNEEVGTVFAATASKERILAWLDSASTRTERYL